MGLPIESGGIEKNCPRLYELIDTAKQTGANPTLWAYSEFMDFLKVAGQPVQGPWPPHQERRPDPGAEALPVAVVEPKRPEPQDI